MSDDFQIGDVIAGVPFGIGVAKITAICSSDDSDPDDCGDSHEPLSCVGEHFPASWQIGAACYAATSVESQDRDAARQLMGVSLNDVMAQLPSEERAAIEARTAALVGEESIVTRLRAENDALRSEVGGLRLRIAAMELTYRAALADRAVPVRVVSQLHRALTVRPGAFGLHTGLEG